MTRQCAQCTNPIPPDLRPNTRFCSARCRNQVAQRRWRANNLDHVRARERAYEHKRKMYVLLCPECGKEFASPHRSQVFCSKMCARHNRVHRRTEERRAARVVIARPPKRIVDNGTLPPDEILIEDRRALFDYRCLMCDRRQQDSVLMTKDRARLIAISGTIPPCFACRGMVYLDEIDLRGQGSPIYGYNAQYAALARTWRVA